MTPNPNFTFLDTHAPGHRIIALQGGTRSGKTYSTLLWIIKMCHQHKGLVISIVRRTMPALRHTVMRDFFDLLADYGLYSKTLHNKTQNLYYLWDNTIEFFSIDDERKVRGRKRDILFVNEANELSLDKWRQLMNRTARHAVIDYNPSDEQGWIYEQVLTRPDCAIYISTYKDNAYLPAELVAEIEAYRNADPNYWRVYGLGQRGVSHTTVYTHWKEYEGNAPDTGDVAYGIDFGYNVPMALVKCTFNMDKNAVWVEELLYRSTMTNTDVVHWLKTAHIPLNAIIYADAAEPDRIEEIYRAGWRGIKKAEKDVEAGIMTVKSAALNLSIHSINLIKEIRHYKWHVDKDNNVLDTPVKINDHAVDAMRYAIHSRKKNLKPRYVFGYI